jgi:hypothetical protein
MNHREIQTFFAGNKFEACVFTRSLTFKIILSAFSVVACLIYAVDTSNGLECSESSTRKEEMSVINQSHLEDSRVPHVDSTPARMETATFALG